MLSTSYLSGTDLSLSSTYQMIIAKITFKSNLAFVVQHPYIMWTKLPKYILITFIYSSHSRSSSLARRQILKLCFLKTSQANVRFVKWYHEHSDIEVEFEL